MNATSAPKGKTTSLNTASWLLAKGIQIDHVEVAPNGNVLFVFPIDQAALQVQEAAFASGAEVSGYALLAAFRQVKSLIRGVLR